VIFLLEYHQNPQETEHRKKEERKHIEKREKEKKRKKKKSSKSLFISRGSQYSKMRKTLQLQNLLFDVIPFSSPPSYHFKNPFQNH
jgi:hypothetical protein